VPSFTKKWHLPRAARQLKIIISLGLVIEMRHSQNDYHHPMDPAEQEAFPFT